MAPILTVDKLRKIYTRGTFSKVPSFQLEADFEVDGAGIIGLMGPNGSGKTTLFELITGSNTPTAGEVRVLGRNIHDVRPKERDRLAIHYHQSYQVRNFRSWKPALLMDRAGTDYPIVHLFDEPQFNTQDGYIGFMLDFFQRLRSEGRVVFLCVHPNEPFHLEILQEICERFIFVQSGTITEASDWVELTKKPAVRNYLGDLIKEAA